jgi:hypothetical protein
MRTLRLGGEISLAALVAALLRPVVKEIWTWRATVKTNLTADGHW